jgi:KaiC/GvpD/RAD55 family RecA-like ATPase
MQWPRIAFAFMLILALASAVTVAPMNVSGQSYVTFTTQVTTTWVYVYPTTTLYETKTTSSYVGVFAPVDFALNVCGQGARTTQKFNAITGQSYHIEWASRNNIPLDFYITTAFAGAENVGCDNSGSKPSSPFSSKYVLFSKSSPKGTVDWVAPSTGQFIAWLWNFSLEAVAGIWSIQRFFPTTVSSVSYATAPTTKLANLTLTTAVSHSVLPFGNLGLLLAIAAVAVVALVLVFARRRKPAATSIQEHPPTIQESPREALASQPAIEAQAIQTQPIISTGYSDLDNALEGGIPEKFSVVIVSPSFDERDLLLRKVMNSALSSGRLAILVSNDLRRTEDMTSRYPKGFYALCPQADKISSHAPNLLKIPSIENLSDANISLGLVLKDILAKEKATKRVMIIDILSDLLLRYKSVMTRRWLTDFVGKRRAEDFTIIATLNPLTTSKEETQSIIDFFDGVIEIFEKPLMERARRFLIIKKMYGQRYSESEMLMDKDKLF